MDEEKRLALEQIGRDLASARYAVAFTGAGISTESGLPDYRGTQGLWKNRRYEELAHIETFLENPAESWQFYKWRLDSLKAVKPNAAHIALAGLQKRRRLGAISPRTSTASIRQRAART
jgi:NAD-dependent protein deacetylase/lipoamidase